MIKGSHHSEKTKKKISDALSGEGHPSFGRKFSKERCENISKSLKGEMNPMFGKTGINSPRFGKHLSSEAREKISKSLTGKPLSEEHKMKISEGMRGLGPEISARMSKAQSGEKNVMYGKHHTEETKLKISNSKKGKTLSLEHRAKLSEAHPKLKGKDNPNYGKKRTPSKEEKFRKDYGAKVTHFSVKNIRQKHEKRCQKIIRIIRANAIKIGGEEFRLNRIVLNLTTIYEREYGISSEISVYCAEKRKRKTEKIYRSIT